MRKHTNLVAVLGGVALLTAGVGAEQDLPAPPPGLWHLLPADAPEDTIPEHRMDIRLSPTPAPFRAAIVNRVTNEDMPYARAEFDGKTLRLARSSADGPAVWLQMKWDGVRFTGTYVNENGEPAPNAVPLKLIRPPR